MKIRNTAVSLCFLITATTAFAQEEQTASPAYAPTSQNHGFAFAPMDSSAMSNVYADSSARRTGDWFWTLSDATISMGGVTAVASNPDSPETWYLGGPNFLAVSHDSGKTYQTTRRFQTFRFADTNQKSVSEDEAQKAEKIRQYLRQELESQFELSFIDSLLEDVSDDELLEAQDVSELNGFENLELDIDTDMTSIELDEDELPDSVRLAETDSLTSRLVSMIARGADMNSAVKSAAASPAVWQIITRAQNIYAVTSGAIFYSNNRGDSWSELLIPADGTAFLSMEVSSDGRALFIGTTDGVLYSGDAGMTWTHSDDSVDGPIVDIHLAGQFLWAVSPSTLYVSSDMTQSWTPVSAPTVDGELLLSILPDSQGGFLALTNLTVYYSSDSTTWNGIAGDLFYDENIRAIYSRDPSLKSFFVQTDAHLYQHKDQVWYDLSRGIQTGEMGILCLTGTEQSHALMASPSGLWMARDAQKIEDSAEYKELVERWSKEPRVEDIIEAALESHFLDDWLDKRWDLRSRLSWLLPKFTFDYLMRKQLNDKHTYAKSIESGTISNKWDFTRETRHEWQVKAFWELKIDNAFKNDLATEMRFSKLKQKRYELIQDVIAKYQKRHTLQISNATSVSAKTVAENVQYILQIQKLEAELNYLSGGFFLPALQHSVGQNIH